MPYRLHVLTVSPLIVLVVPRDDGDRDYCTANIFVQGCLPTAALETAAYWYLRAPSVRPNTFWFSPDLPLSEQYLPAGQSEHTIDLKGSKLTLTARDGAWIVARDR